MSVLQIGIIGIVGAIISLLFQKDHREFSVVIGIAVAVIIFCSIIGRVQIIIDTINQIQSYMSVDVEYIQVILKMLGITYIAQFSSDICKDCGYGSLSTQIELFAKLSILALSMPILLALLETIRVFLS